MISFSYNNFFSSFPFIIYDLTIFFLLFVVSFGLYSLNFCFDLLYSSGSVWLGRMRDVVLCFFFRSDRRSSISEKERKKRLLLPCFASISFIMLFVSAGTRQQSSQLVQVSTVRKIIEKLRNFFLLFAFPFACLTDVAAPTSLSFFYR